MLANLAPRQKAVILGSVMLGLFVSAINQTLVSTATPRVVAELGGLSLYSWVFTSFMLTSTTLVPIVGKLGDIYGRKPLFLAGLVVFMASSVLCGAAQTITQLILFRGLQGLGAGMIMANAFTIIGDLFPPAERGKYQGLFSAVFGVASITGPFVGGYLTDHLSWRWVFYVNLPFGVAALPALYYGLPRVQRAPGRRPIDLLGTLTLVAATVPLLLACVWVGERRYGLASPVTLALLALAALMTALFIVAERRAAEPVLPLHLFRNRVYVVGTVVLFVTGLAMFGVISFVPLFVQGVLGTTATRSGSATMPMMLAMVATSAVVGQLVSRTGRYKLVALTGAAGMAAGMFLLSRMDAATSAAVVARNMALVGLGVGMSMPTLGVAIQNAVPYRLLGVASASTQFFRQMGGMIGVAILGAALVARLTDEMAATMPTATRAQAPPELLARAQDAQTLLNPVAIGQLRADFAALGPDGAQLFAEVLASMRTALAGALGDVFLVGAALMLVAVAVAVLLPERRLRTSIEDADPPAVPGAAVPATPMPLNGAVVPSAAVTLVRGERDRDDRGG
jgi:EmrB/QacA subfamily drug resistance transporter